MPELTAVLQATREQAHEERKFLAALQGIDMDKQAGEAKFKEIMDSVSGGETDPMASLFDVEDMTEAENNG